MSHQIRSTYEANVNSLFGPIDQTDDAESSSIQILRFDEEAMDEFDRFRGEIEQELGAGGDLSDMVAWGSKLPGAVARIAGLLHIADRAAEPETRSEAVSAEVVKRAITLGCYLIPHARAAFALMGADAAVADAVYVMDRIVAKKTMSISRRNLFEQTKSRFKKVKNLDPALVILQEHEYLRQREQSLRSGPGRQPSPVFDVNPFTWSQYSQKSHNS
jgi:hypothetical protein